MRLADVRTDPDFENLIEPLTDEEFLGLESDVTKYKGRDCDPLEDPIHVWKVQKEDGTDDYIVIDGHNRYKILIAHKMDTSNFRIHEEFTLKSEVMEWMINHQDHRRNLKRSARVRAAMKIEEQVRKEKEANLHLASGGDRKSKNFKNQGQSNLTEVDKGNKKNPQSTEILAKKAGFGSKNTYEDAKLIMEKGTPEQIERMDKGGKGNGISTISKEIKDGVPEGHKKCRHCGSIKPINEFSTGSNHNLCKTCAYEMKRKSIEKKREEQKEEWENVPEHLRNSYAPAKYYDPNDPIELRNQDAVNCLSAVYEDCLTKIRLQLRRYQDVIRTEEERVNIAVPMEKFWCAVRKIEREEVRQYASS